MACFLAPAGAAVVTTVVRNVLQNKEKALSTAGADPKSRTAETDAAPRVVRAEGKWTQRLGWLNTMLWGGVALLCLEHIWHGEVVPWPPFLTALETPGAVGPMFREIVTVGLAMTAVIFVVWGIMVAIAAMRKRQAAAADLPDAPVAVTRALRCLATAGKKYSLGFLSLVYLGATLMWLVDHVVVYVQGGGPFLEVTADATGLGLSAVALGLLMWLIRLLTNAPKRAKDAAIEK